MTDSLLLLEQVCEILVELAALEHLETRWRPADGPSAVEDAHLQERYELLTEILRKKREHRDQIFDQLEQECPEFRGMIALLNKQLTYSDFHLRNTARRGGTRFEGLRLVSRNEYGGQS